MTFCWSTLQVRDMDESVRFYEDIVGCRLQRRFAAGPGTEIAFLGEGETQIELICDRGRTDIDIGDDISWGFVVDSVDDKIASLQERDIEILRGPVQPSEQVRFFFIRDPNGMTLQFVEQIAL